MSAVEKRLIRAMRVADQAHQTVGGGTNHYVRECLLPSLEEEGLVVVDRAQRIRDIVAQQWAVAWVILEGSLPLLQTWEFDGLVGEELAKQWDAAFAEVVHDAFHKRWPSTPLARHLAALPSAAEIVGGEP